MLKSHYVEWLESFGMHYDFNQRFGKLIQCIKETNKFKGHYHDTNHLIKVGYLVYLSLARLNYPSPSSKRLVKAVLTPKQDSVVKAALLHDYCYAGEKDDTMNIEHTQSMVRALSFEYPDTLFKTEVDEINRIIAYTHYDFDNPNPSPPEEPAEKEIFCLIRECDQIYSSLYFCTELFDKLYKDIGKRFNYTYAEFILRNKDYVSKIGNNFQSDFTKKVYGEIVPELLDKHDEMFTTMKKL